MKSIIICPERPIGDKFQYNGITLQVKKLIVNKNSNWFNSNRSCKKCYFFNKNDHQQCYERDRNITGLCWARDDNKIVIFKQEITTMNY